MRWRAGRGLASQTLVLAVVLSVVWPVAPWTPAAALGTCRVPPCTGLCPVGPLLSGRRRLLPGRSRVAPARERSAALALSAGLRDWLGLRRNKREEYKRAVTEVSGQRLRRAQSCLRPLPRSLLGWGQLTGRVCGQIHGQGLTDEEKLEAARARRRALVEQDPVYRAKLERQGTIPAEVTATTFTLLRCVCGPRRLTHALSMRAR